MNRSRLIPVLALVLTLSACATTENNHDPIEPVNRVTDKVNDTIDRVTLKPAAQGYTAVVPKPMRTAVTNFFDNATYLNTVLNDFLQGKGRQGFADLSRFLINTTLGAGGFVDVASTMGLERHEEDFGQTLAVWGSDQGAYIIYPLLGPNSVRNTPDFVTATATDPLFWVSFVVAPQVTIPITVLKYVDKRANLLEASDMRDELALDPYVFTREAWRQNREYKIYDGNPPKKQSTDDGWEEDDWGPVEEPEPQADTQSEDNAAGEMAADDSELAVAAEAPIVATAPPAGLPAVETAQSAEPNTAVAANARAYIINLTSHDSEAEAVAEQGRLNSFGIQTEIKQVNIDGKAWYRLRYAEQLEKEQARQKMGEISKLTGLSGVWLEPSK